MCGIVGYWGKQAADAAVVERMADRITHRGPDDAGLWVEGNHGLALGHRRLSIIDLSQAGHQPMTSPCGRLTIIYNGEIYNHLDLRAELEREGGHFQWRGHSDTETLLAGLRHWGVEGCLRKLNGMFAFALWDEKERAVFLARDRLGEKPLYYGSMGQTFLFGSELKALRAHPSWSASVDRDSLALFMRHNYIPAPRSIYRGVHKLPAAHYLVVRANGAEVGDPRCYWDLAAVAESASMSRVKTEQEYIDELDGLLRDAVFRRMAADVPLGAFLSGGYDSSTIAALMQAQSDRPVKTFSIGFHESEYNEAQHAARVARHLCTEHTELYVTPEEAMSVIPLLPKIWDEPFSDSSQIPTFLVSRLTREHVTVSLSGDGGDELFCGYNRYDQSYHISRRLSWIPAPVRRLLAGFLRVAPAGVLSGLVSLLPRRYRVPNLADRLPKLAHVVEAGGGESFYYRLVSHLKDPTSVVLDSREPDTLFTTPERVPAFSDPRERMMFLDSLTYLPDDILTKVDRASMAVSLEARVPLLDHRVVEFAWRVPMEFKYRRGKGKWLLREVLHRYVPQHFMERPKKGFGVPIEHWLRGPLRDWAESLLDERRLKNEGYFDAAPVRRMWNEHQLGQRRWHYYLWDVLMFQAWLESGD